MPKIKKQQPTKGERLPVPKTDIQTPDTQYPVFSFSLLQEEFGLGTCDANQIRLFVSKLRQVSQLTWRDWKLARREGSGYEQIPRGAMKVAIPRVITEDVQDFLVFRFNNGRCAGYRDGVIFNIVWIDCSFQLYKH